MQLHLCQTLHKRTNINFAPCSTNLLRGYLWLSTKIISLHCLFAVIKDLVFTLYIDFVVVLQPLLQFFRWFSILKVFFIEDFSSTSFPNKLLKFSNLFYVFIFYIIETLLALYEYLIWEFLFFNGRKAVRSFYIFF